MTPMPGVAMRGAHTMKKILAILIAALMTASCCFALAEDTGLADVLAKGKLVMGFDEAYPPMSFVDESGEYTGFDIDLAREVASRLGVELSSSRSPGMPRSWSLKPATSTASGPA